VPPIATNSVTSSSRVIVIQRVAAAGLCSTLELPGCRATSSIWGETGFILGLIY
jgi:hypothetical protein